MSNRPPPKLIELERIIEENDRFIENYRLEEIEACGQRFPFHAICLGSPDEAMPAVGIFGGMHGIKRIGLQNRLAYLRSWAARLQRHLELALP